MNKSFNSYSLFLPENCTKISFDQLSREKELLNTLEDPYTLLTRDLKNSLDKIKIQNLPYSIDYKELGISQNSNNVDILYLTLKEILKYTKLSNLANLHSKNKVKYINAILNILLSLEKADNYGCSNPVNMLKDINNINQLFFVSKSPI
jgi:hypothetical protein